MSTEMIILFVLLFISGVFSFVVSYLTKSEKLKHEVIIIQFILVVLSLCIAYEAAILHCLTKLI